MLTFSPIKLGLVVVVALVLFGPDKIPHAARKASHALQTVQQFRERMERELRESVPDLPPTAELARMARSPARILHQLADLPSNAAGQVRRELSSPWSIPGAPSPGPSESLPGPSVPGAVPSLSGPSVWPPVRSVPGAVPSVSGPSVSAPGPDPAADRLITSNPEMN